MLLKLIIDHFAGFERETHKVFSVRERKPICS